MALRFVFVALSLLVAATASAAPAGFTLRAGGELMAPTLTDLTAAPAGAGKLAIGYGIAPIRVEVATAVVGTWMGEQVAKSDAFYGVGARLQAPTRGLSPGASAHLGATRIDAGKWGPTLQADVGVRFGRSLTLGVAVHRDLHADARTETGPELSFAFGEHRLMKPDPAARHALR
jgi:hypothetical protein